jgi:hypothetical protein
VGVLSGFDWVVFRGTLRSIAYVDGLKQYLSSATQRRCAGCTRGCSTTP